MTTKKSFVLYSDMIHTINKLPDDKAGLLFKKILSYVNNEEINTGDLLVEVAFEPIKQHLKRDNAKYKNIIERNKINGKKGGRPKLEEIPKQPTGLTGNPNYPKKADSVIDSDSVIVIDNDKTTVKEKINKKENTTPVKVREIFNFWQTTMGNQRSTLTVKRISCIKSRLSDGYTVDDIKTAINNCFKSEYHMGKNDNGTIYNDLTLICRSGDKLEYFRDSVGAGTKTNGAKPRQVAPVYSKSDYSVPDGDSDDIPL